MNSSDPQLRNNAANSVLWAAIENTGVRATTLAVFMFLTRLLDHEAFGIIALASVYIAFVEIVVRVGITEVIIQKTDLTDLHKDTAYWSTAVLGLLAFLGTLCSRPVCGKAWSDAQMKEILYWLALGIIPTSLSRVQEGLLMRDFAIETLPSAG